MIEITLPNGKTMRFEDTGERVRPVDMEPGDVFAHDGTEDVNEYLGDGYFADIAETWEVYLVENPVKRVKLLRTVK